MLSVQIRPEITAHNNIKVMPVESDIDFVLNSTSMDNYLYVKGNGVYRDMGRLNYVIPMENLEFIPTNAIINNIGITFVTEKRNAYGVYDYLTLKYNGTMLTYIDATAKTQNTMSSYTFTTEQLNGTDIYLQALSDNPFEIELATEGTQDFRLYHIICTITYTEKMHTHICRVKCGSGEFEDLPLYSPVALPRYAFRIMTASGPRSFDLVDLKDPGASPIRLVTGSGLMAVRKIIHNDSGNMFNPIWESLKGAYLIENGTTVFDPSNVSDIVCKEYILVKPGTMYEFFTAVNFPIRYSVAEYGLDQSVISMVESSPMDAEGKFTFATGINTSLIRIGLRLDPVKYPSMIYAEQAYSSIMLRLRESTPGPEYY